MFFCLLVNNIFIEVDHHHIYHDILISNNIGIETIPKERSLYLQCSPVRGVTCWLSFRRFNDFSRVTSGLRQKKEVFNSAIMFNFHIQYTGCFFKLTLNAECSLRAGFAVSKFQFAHFSQKFTGSMLVHLVA